MLLAVQFYDVVLAIHVLAVMAAFGIWFVYPLLVPRGDAASAPRAGPPRARRRQPGGGARAAGRHLPGQRPLVLERGVGQRPLVILIVLMGITGAYFIPRQQRLAELAEA